MYQFRLLPKKGLHFQDGKQYAPGDVVSTPHDLVALFPQKFERVTTPVDAPHSKSASHPEKWEDEEDINKAKAAKTRTMRDK